MKISDRYGIINNCKYYGEVKIMNRFEYIVVSIDGDYANLRRTDVESEELKLVARALLPAEIREGTKLLYEWMEYSIID